MASRLNRWLLKRTLYLTSLYFVLASTQQPTFTTMMYQLGYLMGLLDLSLGWSILFAAAQILLILFLMVLVAACAIYAGFRRLFAPGRR